MVRWTKIEFRAFLTQRVWRKNNAEYDPKNTIPKVKYGGGNIMFWSFSLLREKGDFKEPLDEATYHARTSWKWKDDAWFFLYDSKEVAKEEAHWGHGVYYLVFRPQFYILPSVKEAKTLSCQKTNGFRVAVKSGPKSPLRYAQTSWPTTRNVQLLCLQKGFLHRVLSHVCLQWHANCFITFM